MANIRVRAQAVILDEENRILLVNHVKDGKEYFVLPGGGVEFGETAEESLLRELKEELDITDVKSVKFLKARDFIPEDKSRHILDLYFYVRADVSGVKLAENDGIIKGFGFFSFDELSSIVVYPSREFIIDLVNESVGRILR
jgi:8-oxo-dGTP diphosphatase